MQRRGSILIQILERFTIQKRWNGSIRRKLISQRRKKRELLSQRKKRNERLNGNQGTPDGPIRTVCSKLDIGTFEFRFDQDQTNNTNVYVTGLPTSNFNLEMFANLMKKCGLIKPDEKTNQPKLKLYFDSEVIFWSTHTRNISVISGKT